MRCDLGGFWGDLGGYSGDPRISEGLGVIWEALGMVWEGLEWSGSIQGDLRIFRFSSDFQKVAYGDRFLKQKCFKPVFRDPGEVEV